MTRDEYLAELKLKLSSLSQDELNEAMQYYSDYFDEANDDDLLLINLLVLSKALLTDTSKLPKPFVIESSISKY